VVRAQHDFQVTGVTAALSTSRAEGIAIESGVRSSLTVLHRSRVQKAIVFGSFARGEASRHGDLDLILVQQTDQRFLDRDDGLLCELSRAVPDRDLDVFIYTPESWPPCRSGRLSQRPWTRER
jgi:predicted nucleotidyltransferase